MDQLLQHVGERIVFVIIGLCFFVGIVARAVTTIVTSGARERSRREIAAYIAEGSLTAEQGERLLKADVSEGSASESC